MIEPALPPALAAAALASALTGLRCYLAQAEAGSRIAWRLRFRRGLKHQQLEGFARSLGGMLPPWWQRIFTTPAVVIETRASAAGVEHYLLVPRRFESYVLSQIRATLPGTHVEQVEAPRPIATTAAELRLSSFDQPLRIDTPETSATGLLAAMQPLRRNEELVVQWVVSPAPSQGVSLRGIGRLVQFVAERIGYRVAPPREAIRLIRQKIERPQLWAVARLGAYAANDRRAQQLVRQVLGAFHFGTAPGVSFRRRWLPGSWVAGRMQAAAAPMFRWPCLMTSDELAAFLGVPLGEVPLPGVQVGVGPQLPADAAIPSYGRVLGRSTFPGSPRPLAISTEDSLRHLQIIGPTGVGKSVLMASLATQDMAAGHGVIVLDPKGDLIRDVLARVPRERARDVILLDPLDTDRPVGFNLIGGIEQSPELVTDGIVSIFRNLYAAFWGPRTDDILRSALLTLATQPGMTLCEVPLLLTDEAFRRRLVGGLDDPVGLEPFWGWYDGLSAGERAQAIGPVLNKLRAFLLRRRLRNVIGQSHSGFSADEVLTQRKILLVNLAKGVLGEDSSALLGSALLARLWQGVQARVALAPDARHAVFCHVDEFQDYLNLPTSLADVLAQARGYGFGLTLAHQHLGQLPPQVKQAVLANARSRVVFQANAADASALAKEFAPYVEPTDLQNLGQYEAVTALAAGNRVCPPATIVTEPPTAPTGFGETARYHSRQRYGRDATEVETELRTRLKPSPAAAGVGRRRRS